MWNSYQPERISGFETFRPAHWSRQGFAVNSAKRKKVLIEILPLRYSLGVAVWQWLLGLVGVVVLYAVLQIGGKEKKGCSQLG